MSLDDFLQLVVLFVILFGGGLLRFLERLSSRRKRLSPSPLPSRREAPPERPERNEEVDPFEQEVLPSPVDFPYGSSVDRGYPGFLSDGAIQDAQPSAEPSPEALPAEPMVEEPPLVPRETIPAGRLLESYRLALLLPPPPGLNALARSRIRRRTVL